MKPSRAELSSAFFRTFAVQGSWNYRTLLGSGLAYALLPVLRRVHAGDPVAFREAVARHAGSFNAHPYLAPMAVGALARLELEGVDESTISRFRSALMGPLGALGDRAVWAGWRPLCLLASVVAYGVGLPAWEAALLFLIVYNAGHLWLRAWAFRTGWREGLGVGSVLSRSVLARATRWMPHANFVLLGAATAILGLALAGARGLPPWGGAVALVAGALGYLMPTRGARVAAALLVGGGLLWVL